jgi:flagellar motility protein MotE (MotC chaperone)
MIERPRLLPAVILGAMGLLVLKGMAIMNPPEKVPQTAVAAVKIAGKPEFETLPGFSKFMAKLRSDHVFDPETTGTVDKKDDDKTRPAPGAAPAPPVKHPFDKADVMNGKTRPLSEAEKALGERLGERRDQIEARQRELDMREKLLESVEKKLEGRVGDLKQIEDGIGDTRAKKAEAENQSMKNLVIMYEAMKPKEAARIFDRLNIDVLVPVVQQMNPRKMSEVLAAMTPETAEKLTVAIASFARSGAVARNTAPASGPLPSTELQAVDVQAAPR